MKAPCFYRRALQATRINTRSLEKNGNRTQLLNFPRLERCRRWEDTPPQAVWVKKVVTVVSKAGASFDRKQDNNVCLTNALVSREPFAIEPTAYDRCVWFRIKHWALMEHTASRDISGSSCEWLYSSSIWTPYRFVSFQAKLFSYFLSWGYTRDWRSVERTTYGVCFRFQLNLHKHSV